MNLLIFGFGYTSAAFAERVRARCERIAATVRERVKAETLERRGVHALQFPSATDGDRLAQAVAGADAILVSIPPGPGGDPVLDRFGDAVAEAPRLGWIGYLSTIGVYGDHGGGWVDEVTPPAPLSARSRQRLAAENVWLKLGRDGGKAVQVFRLAGIYGPERSPLQKVLDGTATRVVKPGQVFNRIHVEDVASVLEASLDRPRPGAIYDVADGSPAPPQDVVAFAAELVGISPPPEVPFDRAEMTPMARSFYGENKRVRARLIREELGVSLRYPTYREGLRALAAAGPHAMKRLAAGPK